MDTYMIYVRSYKCVTHPVKCEGELVRGEISLTLDKVFEYVIK